MFYLVVVLYAGAVVIPEKYLSEAMCASAGKYILYNSSKGPQRPPTSYFCVPDSASAPGVMPIPNQGSDPVGAK